MAAAADTSKVASDDDDEIAITVIRSSSGVKDVVTLPAHASLGDLKTAISQSPRLGALPSAAQRIFYLGRELKSTGRSLARLGVGNFGVHVVHLHNGHGQQQQQPHQRIMVKTLLPASPRAGSTGRQVSDDSSVAGTAFSSRAAFAELPPVEPLHFANKNNYAVVVDLLDDDDDDDDEVQVLEPPCTKRVRYD